MMALEDKVVGGEATSLCGDAVLARSVGAGRRGLVDIIFVAADKEIDVKEFAGLRFDSSSGGMMPFVETGSWRGLLLVVGVRELLVFSVSSPANVEILRLYRSLDDDSGFYSGLMVEVGDVLFFIYEGGVVAIHSTGSVLWHRQKFWDDVFVRIDDEKLIFMKEGGATFSISCADGAEAEV
ncbi:hypothetical protein FKV24_014940 [Lysobacter maris]|uniref:Uncharacterized protein n=1 Tax=Marilutibacter maris TaxID=1605891 RepID=A0A5N6AX32_9GAMM|nr:hypothetical protein [Lysobacter maris]KAB8172338.1 hypothetical protein FKV24_014940 [Lysobacter maris]